MHRWQSLMVQVAYECRQAGLGSVLSCLHLPDVTALQLPFVETVRAVFQVHTKSAHTTLVAFKYLQLVTSHIATGLNQSQYPTRHRQTSILNLDFKKYVAFDLMLDFYTFKQSTKYLLEDEVLEAGNEEATVLVTAFHQPSQLQSLLQQLHQLSRKGGGGCSQGHSWGSLIGSGGLDLGQGSHKVDRGSIFALHAHWVQAIISVRQLYNAAGRVAHLQG